MKKTELSLNQYLQAENSGIIGAIVLKEKCSVLLGIPTADNWIRESQQTLVPLWGFQGKGLQTPTLEVDLQDADGTKIEILAYHPANAHPRLPKHWVWVPTHLLNKLVEGIAFDELSPQIEWVHKEPKLPYKSIFFLPENSAELDLNP